MLLDIDILCTLVPLIEEKPWLRENSKGLIYFFIINKVKEKSMKILNENLYKRMIIQNYQKLKLIFEL